MRKHEIKNILVQYFVDGEIFNENALSLIVDVQSVSSSKELELKFQIRNSGKRERKRKGKRKGKRERRERRKEKGKEKGREKKERGKEREKKEKRERR